MSNLSVFNFDNNQITAIVYEGKPAFVAVEVAMALGYHNPTRSLADHCKSLIKLNYTETVELGFGHRPKGIILIREADVYRLVMRSKLESAERFQDWVVEEVLPSLRENGYYGCKPALPDFTDPVAAARAWADEVEQKLLAQKEVERLSIENKQALDYVDRQARYIGNLEKQLRDGLTLPEFAKRLNGVNVQKINAWASKAGWMHKHGKLYMTSSLGRSKGFVYDKDGTYTNNAGEEMWTSKVQLTNDGARKVYREYLKLNLPMKKSWNGEFSNDPFKDGV